MVYSDYGLTAKIPVKFPPGATLTCSHEKGARLKPVNGVYPYVYNMALEVGMIVEHKGVKYRAINNTNELLFEPSAVPALLTPIEEGE